MCFSSGTTLEKLYNVSGMTLVKKFFAELVERQDYKTLNTFFGSNQNTRILNEDIPQSDKHFPKPNWKLSNAAKYSYSNSNQSNSNNQIKYYEFKHTFNQNALELYSRIRARYS